MKTFKFSYEAVQYMYFDIEVKAKTIEEAIKLADKKALDLDTDEEFGDVAEIHRIGLTDDTRFSIKYAKEDL